MTNAKRILYVVGWTLIVLLLTVFVTLVTKMVVVWNEKSPVYAKTHTGANYYLTEDLQGTFSLVLGYTPKTKLQTSGAEGTLKVYLKGNLEVDIPVSLYAPNTWGLEVPQGAEDIFQRWALVARYVENEWVSYVEAERLCKELTGLTFKFKLTDMNQATISVGKFEANTEVFSENENLWVASSALSQLLYNWEQDQFIWPWDKRSADFFCLLDAKE